MSFLHFFDILVVFRTRDSLKKQKTEKSEKETDQLPGDEISSSGSTGMFPTFGPN